MRSLIAETKETNAILSELYQMLKMRSVTSAFQEMPRVVIANDEEFAAKMLEQGLSGDVVTPFGV